MTDLTLKDAVAARAAAQEAGEFHRAALLHRFTVAARECDRLAGDLHRAESRRAGIIREIAVLDHGGAA